MSIPDGESLGLGGVFGLETRRMVQKFYYAVWTPGTRLEYGTRTDGEILTACPNQVALITPSSGASRAKSGLITFTSLMW